MAALRISLLGSLPPPAGGTTLLLAQLAERLRSIPDVEAVVIDTGARGVLARLATIAQIAASATRADVVSLHASPPGIARAGPLLLRLRRPLVVRVFGGGLDLELADARSPIHARLLQTLRGAARVLVETDQVQGWLCEQHPELRVAIQRNSRELPITPPPPPPGRGRFAFVGQVSEAKGALLLADAMRIAAPRGIELDAYGAALGAHARDALAAAPGVRLHGEVAHARIPELLAQADALVLPTQHAAEGHPGAVLEAFAAGRAVVATRHRAIPEIVEHEGNGLLVPPGDVRALADALMRLASDTKLAASLGARAHESARAFDARLWAERFVGHCRAATGSP